MENEGIKSAPGGASGSPGLKKHNISTLTVFFMIFCMVSAGAYGIEDMIPAAGPGLTLVLLAVLPFFWSIPQGLVAAELGSAIPEEGGYYKWIQRGLGEFWGFQGGWWRTLSIYIDSTLYIVLAVGYLSALIEMSDTMAFIIKAALILIFTYINIRGISDVGRLSSYFSIFVMAAFLIMTVLGFVNWNTNPFVPFIPEGQSLVSSIGLGIAICMWMYAGYESMSTMAGEMKNPQVIPKATILSVPAIMLLYILPTMAGLASVGNWDQWSTEGGISFATVASSLGIPAFGIIFGIAAIVSNMSLYSTYLASGSRGFYSMAEDKLCPKFFADIHPKHGTPYKAIISMAIINIILCNYGFDVLVVIDVFLLMFAYILIYIAAIALRIKEPNLKRPFKVPFGTKGLIVFCAAPIILAAVALFTNGIIYFIGGCLGVLSGPIAYFIFKHKYGGMDHNKAIPKEAKTAGIILCGVMAICIAVSGVMLVGDRNEAHSALNDFNNQYLSSAVETDIYFDWGDELYALSVVDQNGVEYSIYYDDDFYGSVELADYYESPEAFAADAYAELSYLANSGVPLAWVDISSGQYLCYGAEYDSYHSAADMVEDVRKSY